MDEKSDRGVVTNLEPDDDEFSLIELANTILRHWRLVLALPILLALGVGLISYTRPRLYGASASFFPKESDGRSVGGAFALAQQFGVDLGSKGPTQSPQFYVDLLQSRALLRQVVESTYEVFGPDSMQRAMTLMQFYSRRDGSARPWLQTVDIVRKQVTPSIARQTGVVRVTVTSPQPGLSEQIAERLLNLVNTFNLEMLQQRAEQENRFLSDRVSEAQANMLAAEEALERFQRQNRQFQNSPELMFQNQRLQRQLDARQEVYTSLLRTREQTRIDAMRDTPLITVIDHATGTAEAQSRGTVAKALLAFLFGLGLAAMIAFLTDSARLGKKSADSGHLELQRLTRQFWSDVRRPSRWFRRPETQTARKTAHSPTA
jgi:uncharacterized protein involved in exopolysaccharide biosynthesis